MCNSKTFPALIFLLICSSGIAQAAAPGFYVDGRDLYSPCGEKVVLYGINKMIYWVDRDGVPSYAEIAKTGANVVRIQWLTPGTAAELDTTLDNAVAQNMIPMIELHDATGDWSMLPKLVDYWVRPEIVAVLQKHEKFLLVNIGNEVGDKVSSSDFRAGYINAVQKMRAAGIRTPLVIDATGYGKNIDVLQSEGPAIIDADPERNILFSVHMWWPYMWGHSDQEVIDEIAESVRMKLPLIIGEFGNQWDDSPQGGIPYRTIIQQAVSNEVGYLAWSWGPGNHPQTHLDMTEDGSYDTLHGWGLEVAVTSPYSIRKNAVRPRYMLNGGNCDEGSSSSGQNRKK